MQAKYCLALQEQHAQKYVCESCGKELTRKDNLKRHQDVCNTHRNLKKDALLEKQMVHLTTLIENLVNKPDITDVPTVNNNNNNNNNRNMVLNNLQPVV